MTVIAVAGIMTRSAARDLACCADWWIVYARRITEFAPREQRLRTWVGTVMLRAGIVAFANAAASYHGADVLGLLRDILVQQLDSQPGPAEA